MRKANTQSLNTLRLQPNMTPREAIEQNVRRRLAQGFQVRPTEDQIADLEKILGEIAHTDPRVTQADVVRGAIDFFVEAWEREQHGKSP